MIGSSAQQDALPLANRSQLGKFLVNRGTLVLEHCNLIIESVSPRRKTL
jgi:hypothetical protein